MISKIWKNRIEFYPYVAFSVFFFFGTFVESFKVMNRPGITLLGLVTIPSVALIATAVFKTYRELPDN